MNDIMGWTKEDFLTSEPYESIYRLDDPFERGLALLKLQAEAKAVGVTNFKGLYNAFEKSVKKASGSIIADNTTNFPGQPIELDCGTWYADTTGIYQENTFGARVYACPHPIMPVERLVNVDTGNERLRLAYQKGTSPWRSLIVEKSVLASAAQVTQLAGRGIAVTSENAKMFIKYLAEVETLNYDRIPETRSIGRLGYIPDVGFSPYVQGLTFDGDANFKALYETVQKHGSFDGDGENCWLHAARWARRSSVTARLMLAASFASPLLSVIGALPFFVHLWGVDSGTGKTVALMLAASVWGNPALGKYIQSFNSTVVGQEFTAAFLNQLPLCLDELQLAKDSKGRTNFDVYKLAQGSGRTRGTKVGGVAVRPTWANAILTTGESPLTGTSDGAGAVNRVLDIECVSGSPAIPEGCGMWLSGLLKKHYGHAGRIFVETLYQSEDNQNEARRLYESFFQQLSARDTTEKQAMAAAAILTADTLVCRWVIPGEPPTSVDEIAQFLASKSSASAGQRGYEFVISWIAMNKTRFQYDADTPEIWGRLENDPQQITLCYVVSSKLRQALESEGFSANAVQSWMLSNGKIPRIDKGKKTVCTQRINGIPTKCVCVLIE